MDTIEYFDGFESRLTESLLGICKQKGALGSQFLLVEELEEKWHDSSAQYMADAVPQFNQYPLAAIAWAGYFGMGAAAIWDGAWESYQGKDFYGSIASPRGFDEMDEYVLEELLGYEPNSQDWHDTEQLMLSCAEATYSLMQSERIESGTKEAFFLFARAAKVFFKLGVSLELKQLGYSYKKMSLPLSKDQVN